MNIQGLLRGIVWIAVLVLVPAWSAADLTVAMLDDNSDGDGDAHSTTVNMTPGFDSFFDVFFELRIDAATPMLGTGTMSVISSDAGVFSLIEQGPNGLLFGPQSGAWSNDPGSVVPPASAFPATIGTSDSPLAIGTFASDLSSGTRATDFARLHIMVAPDTPSGTYTLTIIDPPSAPGDPTGFGFGDLDFIDVPAGIDANWASYQVVVNSVIPAPGAVLLVALGVGAFAAIRRRFVR